MKTRKDTVRVGGQPNHWAGQDRRYCRKTETPGIASRIANYIDKSEWVYALPIVGGIKAYRRQKQKLFDSGKPIRKIDKFVLFALPIAYEALKLSAIDNVIEGKMNGDTAQYLFGNGLTYGVATTIEALDGI